MKEPTAIGALITATRPSEQRECERHGPFISYRYSGDRQSSCPQCALEASIAESKALVAEREVERSEEHTSELQSLMRNSYAVFCLKKKKSKNYITVKTQYHG